MTAAALPGRRGVGRPRKARNVAELADDVFGDVEAGMVQEAESLESMDRYREEPVLYARERLGVELLPHQQAVAYGVAKRWDKITPEMRELAQMENEGHRKISITSGQKTGKSLLIVCLALWFYDCFPDARALMTAAKGDQIRSVLWRELERLLNRAPHRPAGALSTDPSRGLLSVDRSREIRGFTGRSIEALAGISGNLLYFVDEASHLEQSKAEAIEGNTAGESDLDAPIIYTSNPTRCEGPFFESHHSKREYWTRAHFDSEKIAEWQERRGRRLPGMVTRARIESWKEEYGVDSPFYVVRVKGDFLRNETGKIIHMHLIEAARERWATAPEEGTLAIGYDPAGPGTAGDEHAFAVVRGKKCLSLHTRRGLNEEAALAEVYALLKIHRREGEIPRVSIDAEGLIGSAYYGRLRAESEHRRLHAPGATFEVYGVRTSSKHVRDPRKFERVRDELWWVLSQWMIEGAIPLDHALEAELYAPVWIGMPDGRIRATPKIELRDFLGRSPDRGDGLGLAVWTPRVLRAEENEEDDRASAAAAQDVFESAAMFDLQSAGDPWWPAT